MFTPFKLVLFNHKKKLTLIKILRKSTSQYRFLLQNFIFVQRDSKNELERTKNKM